VGFEGVQGKTAGMRTTPNKRGKVYLVGAGPGDPGLLTVKALECLRLADVVVYDRLVDISILEEAPRRAERIYVGKAPQGEAWRQDAINEVLIDRARKGKKVVRLKGGDPFVFGRGGEEAMMLVSQGIPFEIVPGISAAVAVPAYAGIPVTHRDFASAFTVITGHLAQGKDNVEVRWEYPSPERGTLVILMGMANLPNVVQDLRSHEWPGDTPVAVIAEGTSCRQRCVIGCLDDIVARSRDEDLTPPAVVVVGEVARMRENLSWFDSNPLFGKRVAIFGTVAQTRDLGQRLRGCGAIPLELPILQIQPPLNWKELDDAIVHLDDFRWVVFTSTLGVDAFFGRLFAQEKDVRNLAHLRVGVIGPTTARVLEERGLRADFMPHRYNIGGFLADVARFSVDGSRVLLPLSDTTGGKLVSGLAALGADVHVALAYQTIPNPAAVLEGLRLMASDEIDVAAFTSYQAVTHTLGSPEGRLVVADRVKIACIGPKTAAAALRHGLKVDVVARDHTLPGLMDAMEEHFRGLSKGCDCVAGLDNG